MLKDKKLEFQAQLEEYLEDQKIYDIFEDMMKSLIVSRPKEPMKFLLDKLQSKEVKRLIIVGPPGCKRKEIALSLSEYLSEETNLMTCISVGDLLIKENSKKSELGKLIVEARKTYSYVPDDIVIQLVKQQIELLEKEKKSWIIEGFPRTRQQALALQKMGIMPDKLIMLDVREDQSIEKIKKNLKSEDEIIHFKEEDIEKFASNALQEYKLHIEGVKQACKGQIIQIDGNKAEGVVLEEIVRILKLNRSRGPRRPPRIILLGPPGCGKTDYGRRIAEKYKLQYVKISHIMKDLIRTEGKSAKGKDLKARLETGQPFPDELVIDIVRQRLNKPDCQINGWILDGCPTTPEQIIKLDDLGIIPSLVVVLDQSDEVVFEKIEQRRYDPIDGVSYNIINDKVPDSVLPRLVQQNEHTHPIVKKKLWDYTNFLATVEDQYRRQLIRINAEEDSQNVFLNFCDAIENTV